MKSENLIELSGREHFVFEYIKKHNGGGIPEPLPQTVLSLNAKGLVRFGERVPSSGKTRCYITDLKKG